MGWVGLGWMEWIEMGGKKLIVVWVVGSSWLMMLLIRGASTVILG